MGSYDRIRLITRSCRLGLTTISLFKNEPQKERTVRCFHDALVFVDCDGMHDQLGQPLDEAGDAIVETTGWVRPIRSHDLETTQRSTSSSGYGDGRFEQVRIIREVCDRERDKFLIWNSVGSWSLRLATGEARDSGKNPWVFAPYGDNGSFSVVSCDHRRSLAPCQTSAMCFPRYMEIND
jgi:hypothetical protein